MNMHIVKKVLPEHSTGLMLNKINTRNYSYSVKGAYSLSIKNKHPLIIDVILINNEPYLITMNYTHKKSVKLESGERVKGTHVGVDAEGNAVYVVEKDIEVKLLNSLEDINEALESIEKRKEFYPTTTPKETNDIVNVCKENMLRDKGYENIEFPTNEMESRNEFIQRLEFMKNEIIKKD
jgi:hypothetical protein